ncbi:MAG TPA: lamin tail domain-containing protein [Myxococcaceae bacterium]
MPFRPPVLRLASLVASALLVFSGCDCGRECTVNTDCPEQGQVCDQGVCKDSGDAGQHCSPACPATQFCDLSSLTCKNCDGTFQTGTQINRGCLATQPVCDTAANGGLGQCRNCAPTPGTGGSDLGCGGTTPICDPSGNSGSGVCVTCSARGGCGNGRVCDTSVIGGACKTCLVSTDAGVAPGCTAVEPVCVVSGTTQSCKVCTAAAGCTGGTICDPTANLGKGQCDFCRPSTDGGAAPGCTAFDPVCDTARDGGFGGCIVCNAGAGCGAPLICDSASNGGVGTCKNCFDGSGSTDPGCNSGSPVCNTAGAGGLGACVGCLASADCTTPPNLVCDTAANLCKVCLLGPPQQGCGTTQVCDPLANGGQGACLGCTGDPDCALPDGGASFTPFCRTAPPPGTCVECITSPNCADPARPACNANNVCGCAVNADCAGNAAKPVCDSAANSGNGACVQCTPTQGCGPSAPFCSNNVCICRDNSDCSVGQECLGSPATCQNVDLSGPQGAIGFYADAGTGALNLIVDGAYITYFKPAIGTFVSDPPGFFVQAQASGPGMYVATDPVLIAADGGSLAVGDRIQFTVLNKANVGTTGMTAVMLADGGSAVSGMTVLSTNHPVLSLSTSTPAGLVSDISAAADLVSNLPKYQARVVSITGGLDGGFVGAGTNHLGALFATPGLPAGTGQQLRMPDTLVTQLELSQGCRLTLTHGPVWRFTATAQPSAYSASDITGVVCPGPKVVSADSLSLTTVEVAFNRNIGAASVAPGDFSIPGLTVSGATVSGTKVVLTVDAQTPDQAYTVTVTGVTDTLGDPNDLTANTYTFRGYVGPQTGIIINEVDYDQPSTDTTEFVELANIGASPISLGGLQVLLVNGGNTATPRREYQRYRLDGVTDGTNPVLTLPPGGVIVLGSTLVTAALPAGTLRMTIKANSATPDSNIIQNGGIAAAPESDGLGIIHYATGTLMDALFYETSTQSSVFNIATGVGDVALDFAETARAPLEDPGNVAGSLERKKSGAPAAPQDTNDNSADFQLTTAPTAGTL